MDEIDMERIGDSGIPALKPLEVLECLGYQSPTNAQCKECGSILRELFGEPKRINGSNKWRVPFKPYESPMSYKYKEPEEQRPTAADF